MGELTPNAKKATILVVDDTPDNLTLMSGLLKNDYIVKVANGGPLALKVANLSPPPDLILLDIMMPVMDGYEVCRRLKASEATSRIPVIFLTAKTETEDEAEGFSVGAVDFIHKPISPPIVAARIKAQLELKSWRDFLQDQNDWLQREVEKRLQATLELEALKRELDMARQIQAGMLPLPPLFSAKAGVVGCGFMRAARQIGGDFYDAFALPDGHYFVAIGDVCNKGAPAALFMMRTLTVLRNEVLHPYHDIDKHLGQLAASSNDILNAANDAEQFVTLFFGIIDLTAGRLHFVNAGHNLPILRRPGEPAAFLKGIRNPIAGIFPNLRYQASSCEFPAGSLLLLYTDGVTEAENKNSALFGDDSLLQLMADYTPSHSADCLSHIVAAVDTFADGHPQSDDITLLMVHRP